MFEVGAGTEEVDEATRLTQVSFFADFEPLFAVARAVQT
jgi:hypothetical protein